MSGVIVLDKPGELSEGTRVRVEPVRQSKVRKVTGTHATKAKNRLPGEPWATLLKYAGKAKGLPPDFAEQHDHYIHGVPKK